MNTDIQNGLLKSARYSPSPHQDERPKSMQIDAIVVHNISLPPDEYGSDAIEQFFLGKLDEAAHPYFATIATQHVSSHLLVKRTGEILQFVPFDKRAWHAGESNFQGREKCNDFSIGIELEGSDHVPYEDIQYHRLASVIKALQQTYPLIQHDRIIGHSEIAPERKTDPGPAFDWKYLKGMLA